MSHIGAGSHYTSDSVAFRGRAPATSQYLNCNVAGSLAIFYSALPTDRFALLERNQSAFIDLPHPEAAVKLQIRHHDPDVQAMFDDPANVAVALIKLHRVVRFERR